MFAFCPSIDHSKCGIPNDHAQGGVNMGLRAGLQKKHV